MKTKPLLVIISFYATSALGAEISTLISVENSQNLFSDYNKINVTQITVAPTIKFEDISLGLLAIISQNHQKANNTNLSNTVITLKKSFQEIDKLRSSFSTEVTLPTDAELRKENRLNLSLAAAYSLGKSAAFNLSALKIDWTLRLAKAFHEYNLSSQGTPLIEYIMRNRISANYELSQSLTISSMLEYINGLTYGRFPRERFVSSIGIDYAVNEKTTLGFGVSTEGTAKKANESDLDISFFDENTSTLSLGMNYIF